MDGIGDFFVRNLIIEVKKKLILPPFFDLFRNFSEKMPKNWKNPQKLLKLRKLEEKIFNWIRLDVMGPFPSTPLKPFWSKLELKIWFETDFYNIWKFFLYFKNFQGIINLQFSLKLSLKQKINK